MFQHPQVHNFDYDVLDLYDIALLLVYEWYTVHPRMRHTKLVDLARGGQELTACQNIRVPAWKDPERRADRVGYVFETAKGRERFGRERDTPKTMLPLTTIPAHLPDSQMEMIFMQARAHTSCDQALLLIDYFFGMYKKTTLVHVRMDDGTELTTIVGHRSPAAYILTKPRQLTMSIVYDGDAADVQVSGDTPVMTHTTMGFIPDSTNEREKTAILDLTSLAFGDAGRGAGRRSLFLLENMDRYGARMHGVAESALGPATCETVRPGPEDEWLRDIARRVKARYDRRDIEHWCGHCGAPVENNNACATCRAEWYCNQEHQMAALHHHQHWCEIPKGLLGLID